MKRIILMTAVVLSGPLAMSGAGAKRAQTPPPDLRGGYVGGNDVTSEEPNSLGASLNVQGVDGFLLVVGWNYIEPRMGNYRWDTVDFWMNRAITAGKKVSLSVMDGMKTPSWLFQSKPAGAGITPHTFSITRKGNGSTGVCDTETIAAPWDTVFLARWDSMLNALSTHLKSAGPYDAIVLMRLTGINMDSDELHLPAETAQSSGLPCVSDAIAGWQGAGYRPSLLLGGWNSITDSFLKHFPDKSFSVAIIAITNPFPPIADDGSVLKLATSAAHESLSVAQNLPLLTLASQKFPGRLVIQNNTLYVGEPAQPQTVHAAEGLKAMIAFQTNEDLPPGNDKRASCGSRGDTASCTDTTFIQMLETGIYPVGKDSILRAQYIEVFAANVNAFPQDVLRAHNELFGSLLSDVRFTGRTVPLTYALGQNYPNPFNPSTMIRYTLAFRSHVILSVFSTLGQQVAVIINETQDAGEHDARFDGSDLSSGVYFYRIQAGSFITTRRMLLLR